MYSNLGKLIFTTFTQRKGCGGMFQILVVEDDASLRKLMSAALKQHGYSCHTANDGVEALDVMEKTNIDLIISDVMMPNMDGWQVCREIRETSQVPIIMLTARADERDELKGFEIGVDEYIAKPFSPKVLMARVTAILRRTAAVSEEALTCGAITLDRTAHEVTVDGERVDLSYKEFELLAYFMENQGVALSRETILNQVWNYDYYGDARTIDTHVKKLRNKLGTCGEYIQTIWGMGYKFDVK